MSSADLLRGREYSDAKNLSGYQYNNDGITSGVYQFGRMIIGGFVLELLVLHLR